MVRSKLDNIIRRPKMDMSWYSVNQFHLRNPWVVAWWSLAYPGFGHFTLNSNIKGVFFITGELLLNYLSHINLAILYSFTGNFQMAKSVLDIKFTLIYNAILVFAVWDSYRLAVEFNKLSVLADREKGPLTSTVIKPWGINALEKRNPWLALAWSSFLPGLGHLYLVRISGGVFLIIIGILIIGLSRVVPAIHFSFMGSFEQAKIIVDPQWLLNLPSFYGFAIYDSYVNAVENNKLFDKEQAMYLTNNFQESKSSIPLSLLKEGNKCML